MSARSPFVPQRLVPNRPSTTNPENNTPFSDDTFRPNGLLQASHSADDSDIKTSPELKSLQSEHNQSLTNLKAGINKPLNLRSFAKKQPSNASGFVRHRRSAENNSVTGRSGSPKLLPSNHQQALHASAPRPSSPFFPISSSLVSMAGFKSTAALSHTNLHLDTTANDTVNDDLSSNGTHIATSSAVIDLCVPSPDLGLTPRVPPLSGTRVRSSSRPRLERIQETPEEHNEGFARYAHDGFSGIFGNIPVPETETQFTERIEGETDIQHTLKRAAKRGQQAESEDEQDYGSVAKRYKTDSVCLVSFTVLRLPY